MLKLKEKLFFDLLQRKKISTLIIPVLRAASSHPACLPGCPDRLQPTATALLFALLPDLSSFLFSVCKFRLLRNDVGETAKVQKPTLILKALTTKLEMRVASS